MTMVTSKPRTLFKLMPAKEQDFDAISDIDGDSFLCDTHTLLKAVWKGKDFHRKGSREMLVDLFANPRVDMIVAREGLDGSGKVLGSIIWGKRGYPETAVTETATVVSGQGTTGTTDIAASTASATTTTAAASATSTTTSTVTTTTTTTPVSSTGPLPPPPPPVQPTEPGAPLTIAELEKTTHNAMLHFVDHLMPDGVKCRYIYSLSVAPAYQGQGIGSALMKWGTDLADKDNVFCWVSSSMSGWTAYAKAGFIEIGRLDLELDNYAQGVKRTIVGPDGMETTSQEWGNYIWRWMRRDPQIS
ncbi:hypothetical protein BGZ94_001781 [Podila epigama]|nr:hypothetical protein BGZ94_001781 [Podila epigama]